LRNREKDWKMPPVTWRQEVSQFYVTMNASQKRSTA
jgi:hypothetical protein